MIYVREHVRIKELSVLLLYKRMEVILIFFNYVSAVCGVVKNMNATYVSKGNNFYGNTNMNAIYFLRSITSCPKTLSKNYVMDFF